jgi:hypothetical protein
VHTTRYTYDVKMVLDNSTQTRLAGQRRIAGSTPGGAREGKEGRSEGRASQR